MRRSLFTLVLVALGAAAFGAYPTRVAGNYKLVPSEKTRQFCRRHHIDLPTGRLSMRNDRTFTLVVNDDEGTARVRGAYDIDGDYVDFVIEEGDDIGMPRHMRLDDEGLRGRDMEFSREDPVVERPRIREDREPVIVREAPRPAPLPAYEIGRHAGSIEGSWTLQRAKGEDASTRFTFDKNGTFRYKGENSSSRGRYEIVDGGIELTWTEIDGEPVDRDAHIRKVLPFSYSGEAFYVDTYRYERSGR